MQGYLERNCESVILDRLEQFPVVALLGPRQCGKSTLAKHVLNIVQKPSLYLDLERPSDLAKLTDPEQFFEFNKDRLICIDEIHRSPDLFSVIRSVVDDSKEKGRLLILGSASQELLKQSAESLAGRIAYIELTPFFYPELTRDSTHDLWLKGGFPDSILTKTLKNSLAWRDNFIRTFIERDIPQFGIRIPSVQLNRFIRMISHVHGQLFRGADLSKSLGVSYHTVKHYIDLFCDTYVLRLLAPYETSLKKRLVKSPKVYVRDTGILHTLLGIETMNDLMGHPVYGFSWEGYVIEAVCRAFPGSTPYFYKTSAGAEIDLILEKGQKRIAIECKASTAPKLERGFYQALEDLQLSSAYVVAPISTAFPVKPHVMAISLPELIDELRLTL